MTILIINKALKAENNEGTATEMGFHHEQRILCSSNHDVRTRLKGAGLRPGTHWMHCQFMRALQNFCF